MSIKGFMKMNDLSMPTGPIRNSWWLNDVDVLGISRHFIFWFVDHLKRKLNLVWFLRNNRRKRWIRNDRLSWNWRLSFE